MQMVFIFVFLILTYFTVVPALLPGVPGTVQLLRADRTGRWAATDICRDRHLGLGGHHDV